MIRKLSSLEDILTLLEENKKNGELKTTKGSLEDIAGLFEKEAENTNVEKKLPKKGSLEDIAGMFEKETESSHNTVHEGKMYNTSGYSICGVLNQHNKPCQRIGKCPFHHKEEETVTSPRNIMPKLQYPTTTTNQPHTLPQQIHFFEQSIKNQNIEFLPPNLNTFSKLKSTTTTINQSPTMINSTITTTTTGIIPNNLFSRRVAPTPIPMMTGLNPSLLNSLNPMSNVSKQMEELNVVHREKKIKSEDVSTEEKIDVKKKPFKHGWTKEEHLKFLTGLEIHGKGQWKQIAALVGTRSPTQIQSHAQKYFLRQRQETKNKRSIHDLTIEDLKSCFSQDEKKQKTK